MEKVMEPSVNGARHRVVNVRMRLKQCVWLETYIIGEDSSGFRDEKPGGFGNSTFGVSIMRKISPRMDVIVQSQRDFLNR